MISIDIYSRIPIYIQIVDGIKQAILLKMLAEGEQIQSVREFSVSVGVNPNTVSKAYLELERQNLLTGAAGKGYFVTPGAYERLREASLQEAKKAFMDAKNRLLENGVSAETLKQWISATQEEVNQ